MASERGFAIRLLPLGTVALAFFSVMAAVALQNRGSAGLPDIVSVPGSTPSRLPCPVRASLELARKEASSGAPVWEAVASFLFPLVVVQVKMVHGLLDGVT
jgi:hypothetical protein